MNAIDKLSAKLDKKFHICVGLDSDISKIPSCLLKEDDPIFMFNKILIENTCHAAAAYKINFAFYESLGIKGIETLYKTISIIPEDILTIADAKRGDIGNTSEMYAKAIYEEMKFDSVTLHPYMGYDSMQPFLNYKDKLNFFLTLTSNPGSQDFEKSKLFDGSSLYQKIIQSVNEWSIKNNNCGIVFGATNIDELNDNISSFGNLFILLPGIGAQGGSLEDVLNVFNKNMNSRFLINFSRALIYSDSSPNFGMVVKKTIDLLNQKII